MKCHWILLFVAFLLPRAPLAIAAEFEADVAPILQAQCLSCHDSGADGGVRFDLREDALEVLVPGEPDISELLNQVRGPEPAMPKDADPLTEQQVETLRDWIAAGAPWPEGRVLEDKPLRDLGWWSLQPIANSVPPSDGHPVDAFLNADLDERGLQPVAPADPATLYRRLSFDLTGLPPDPVGADSFSMEKLEATVDRLLDSPEFGETWARHWLDVARYAETHGYDKDKPRENAWPYRDYVIAAFNDDKPYDRFVQEQIAGDALFPDEPDGVLGLGFLAAGPWDFIGHTEVGEEKVDGRIAKHLDRDEMISAVFNVFTSTTVQCAQCHHHKFDPVTMQDYYRLHAVFAAVDRADRVYSGMPVADDLAERVAETEGRRVYAAASRFETQGQFIATGGEPRPIHLLHRGDIRSPGDSVSPGMTPLWPGAVERFALAENADESDARAALARAISSRDNPLLWRSIVNRLWQWTFGRPLVGTPNDFGRMGTEPTHPELLDYLAARLRDDPQHSLKSIIRLLVTSEAYSRGTQHDASSAERDANNDYLWRANRRRLTAEEYRDALLAISGKLRLEERGGPSFQDFVIEKPQHSPHYEYHLHDPENPASHRRSIYRFIVRSQPQPFLTALDCADPSISVPGRDESTTALQALAQWNNRLVETMSRHFGRRIEEHDGDAVEFACRTALGRLPDLEQREVLGAYLENHGPASLARVLFNLNAFVYVD